MYPPVHRYSSQSEDRNIDCDRLDEEHQVAHGAAKHPAVWVEGISESKGDAGHTHEHVREGQVSDEEVGDIVHLAGSADDVEEQVISEDANHHHERVTGDDERLESLQQCHIRELGAVIGGVALYRDFISASFSLFSRYGCVCASSRATVVSLHWKRVHCIPALFKTSPKQFTGVTKSTLISTTKMYSVQGCNHILMKEVHDIYQMEAHY